MGRRHSVSQEGRCDVFLVQRFKTINKAGTLHDIVRFFSKSGRKRAANSLKMYPREKEVQVHHQKYHQFSRYSSFAPSCAPQGDDVMTPTSNTPYLYIRTCGLRCVCSNEKKVTVVACKECAAIYFMLSV